MGQSMEIDGFKGRLLIDVPMKDYTSLSVGGTADVMAFPADKDDLRLILLVADKKGLPIYIIGAGTNILIKDGGIGGIVVNLSDGFDSFMVNNISKVFVGAGLKISVAVNHCLQRGLTGMEFAVGVPGTIGGAVAMNAGAFGGEIKDCIETVEVMDRKGVTRIVDNKQLGFSYRGCNLPAGSIIVGAVLRLAICDRDDIRHKIQRIRRLRKRTGSINFPNAGSIFKNPVGDNAGRLIEEVGLKGERYGNAMISDVHANYVVNMGGAKAKDILALVAFARDKVFQLRGIILEPEIRVIGRET